MDNLGVEAAKKINWENLGVSGFLIIAIAWVFIKYFEFQSKGKQAKKEEQNSPDRILVKIVTEALQESSRINAELVTMIKQQGEAMGAIAEGQRQQAGCVQELQRQMMEVNRNLGNLALEVARKEN